MILKLGWHKHSESSSLMPQNEIQTSEKLLSHLFETQTKFPSFRNPSLKNAYSSIDTIKTSFMRTLVCVWRA